jgi:predicted 3-demethylubiquinone-9 3-methyltransferase (glyoxalase superfamily)
MQRITPCLWFDNRAEEAVAFYTGIFKNSKILATTRYGEAGAKVSGQTEGSVMSIIFQLDGQEFLALNGGPIFKITEAISMIVNCETQGELDEMWNCLAAGGREVQCGWLTDKFGLSWQVVPTVVNQMLTDPDPAKSQRVMEAILSMVKIDIAALQRAFNGQ